MFIRPRWGLLVVTKRARSELRSRYILKVHPCRAPVWQDAPILYRAQCPCLPFERPHDQKMTEKLCVKACGENRLRGKATGNSKLIQTRLSRKPVPPQGAPGPTPDPTTHLPGTIASKSKLRANETRILFTVDDDGWQIPGPVRSSGSDACLHQTWLQSSGATRTNDTGETPPKFAVQEVSYSPSNDHGSGQCPFG